MKTWEAVAIAAKRIETLENEIKYRSEEIQRLLDTSTEVPVWQQDSLRDLTAEREAIVKLCEVACA
jgi:hypothetical protein